MSAKHRAQPRPIRDILRALAMTAPPKHKKEKKA